MALEAALTPSLWPSMNDANIKVPVARLEPIIIELVDIGNPFGLVCTHIRACKCCTREKSNHLY